MPERLPLTRRFPFRGDSMRPLLAPGDAVWVRSVAWARLRPGDLVVYGRFGDGAPALVVHRLLGLSGDGGPGSRLRSRGDARAAEDPPVEAAELLGRVVAMERGGRLSPLSSARGRLLDAWSRLRGALLRLIGP